MKAKTTVWSLPPQHQGVGLKHSATTGQCLLRNALKALLETRTGVCQKLNEKIWIHRNLETSNSDRQECMQNQSGGFGEAKIIGGKHLQGWVRVRDFTKKSQKSGQKKKCLVFFLLLNKIFSYSLLFICRFRALIFFLDIGDDVDTGVFLPSYSMDTINQQLSNNDHLWLPFFFGCYLNCSHKPFRKW